MEENKDQAQEVKEEALKVDDRPVENYKAEIERRKQEAERLRMELEAVRNANKRTNDPNDLTTWDEGSLKQLKNSADPQYARFKEQAEDILLSRKVEAIRAKEREQERRDQVNSQLAEKFPEALDSGSEFAAKVDKVMREYDLAKTPAGRLAAARIVAAEAGLKGKSAEQIEKDRVASLKANMTDGDRPRPVDVKKPNDSKSLKDKIFNEKDTSHEAMGEYLDSKNLRERFNKVWGR